MFKGEAVWPQIAFSVLEGGRGARGSTVEEQIPPEEQHHPTAQPLDPSGVFTETPGAAQAQGTVMLTGF